MFLRISGSGPRMGRGAVHSRCCGDVFPGFSRAWSTSNRAYLAVIPQVSYKTTLDFGVPVSSKISLALIVSQHPFVHEAGARISKERDGSDRSSARLDTLTASSLFF